MKLTIPPQYRDRFEFVFHVDQSADGATVVCRAEIYEYSVLMAVLQIADTKLTRVEVVDVLLARCIRWADLRIRAEADR
uniref:hypothetical protein n=1 Tax=unclassified Variovorax TaxID=663243 RepID=UPI000D3BAA6A